MTPLGTLFALPPAGFNPPEDDELEGFSRQHDGQDELGFEGEL